MCNVADRFSLKRGLGYCGMACVLLIGCASPQEILKTGLPATFNSAKSAPDLAACIDRNTDGAILNSLVTNIKTLSPELFEIVVRNGSAVWAVVQIRPAASGSVASFSLGGLASMAPETEVERMTTGCQ